MENSVMLSDGMGSTTVRYKVIICIYRPFSKISNREFVLMQIILIVMMIVTKDLWIVENEYIKKDYASSLLSSSTTRVVIEKTVTDSSIY
jgi:hypothetical protein